MKKTDNISPFEEQIMHSSRRMCDEQNRLLPLRESPRPHYSSTWIVSIAAAVVGWAVGIAFPIAGERHTDELAMLDRFDTVVQYKERLVHDTIVQKVEIPVRVEVASARCQPELFAGAEGCNVECDGIDYSMLIDM